MISEKYQKKPWLLYKPGMNIFRLLHRFTIRIASITVVTNDFLTNIVNKLGGRSFVLPGQVPENIILTGFVSEEYFIALLRSADLVIVLMTAVHCMLCGCYEAVAAQKPLITSDKYEMRNYFDRAVFVDNSSKNKARNIDRILDDLSILRVKSVVLKVHLGNIWQDMAVDLESRLQKLGKNKRL